MTSSLRWTAEGSGLGGQLVKSSIAGCVLESLVTPSKRRNPLTKNKKGHQCASVLGADPAMYNTIHFPQRRANLVSVSLELWFYCRQTAPVPRRVGSSQSSPRPRAARSTKFQRRAPALRTMEFEDKGKDQSGGKGAGG